MKIRIQRIYDDPQPDGCRILVDRLWPRGISKQKAALDDWRKDLAPSPALRKWFDHDETKWKDFRKKYLQELKAQKNAAMGLLESARGKKTLILLYGAKSDDFNHAIILKEFLDRMIQNEKSRGFE